LTLGLSARVVESRAWPFRIFTLASQIIATLLGLLLIKKKKIAVLIS
jgi:hypothetical protein